MIDTPPTVEEFVSAVNAVAAVASTPERDRWLQHLHAVVTNTSTPIPRIHLGALNALIYLTGVHPEGRPNR